MKILVVDDSKTARIHLRKPLEKVGWTVEEAENVDEALHILTGADQFDLVITDYNMPGKTGLFLVQELRRRDECVNCNIDVIFLTSDSSEEIRSACSGLAVRAFALKPINPAAMISLIKKVIEGNES